MYIILQLAICRIGLPFAQFHRWVWAWLRGQTGLAPSFLLFRIHACMGYVLFDYY